MIRRIALVGVALLVVSQQALPQPVSSAGQVGAPSPGLPADPVAGAAVLMAEDTRTVTPELEALTRSEDPALRARAALAIGRIGLPSSHPRLLEMMRDRDPGVRGLAAFAVGKLEYAIVPAMAAALRERAGESLQPLLDDLPWVARQAALALGLVEAGRAGLEGWLLASATSRPADRPPAVVLAAAVEAWWHMPGAGPAPIVPFAGSAEVEVRRATAHALRRLSDPNARPYLLSLLEDPDVEVRLHALRGLHGAPASLAEQRGTRLLFGRDWREQCAALEWIGASWRLPSTQVGDQAFSDVLRRSLDRNLHVRRCALSALAATAERRAVAGDRLLEALAEPEAAVRATAMVELASAGGTLAEEAARRVRGRFGVDGEAEAPALASVEMLAGVGLLEAANGEDDRRVLQALLESDDSRLRIASLGAWQTLEPERGWAVAVSWLDSTVAPLIRAALDTIDDLLSRGALPQVSPFAAGLVEPIWRLYYDSVGPESAPVRMAALRALVRLDREVMTQRASLLLEQPDRVLRLEAFHLLGDRSDVARGLRAPEAALAGHATGRTPADYRDLAERVRRLQNEPPRLVLVTEHGEALIELRPEQAPLTVIQFLDLLDAGFYEDSPFHRVIAGFVAQGGTRSRPPWSAPTLRSEDSPVDYGTGSVGLALAGKDTGASQFFITHGPTPHLEGRYPVFGEVVEGHRAVGRIQPGDTMRLARRPR